MQITINNVKIYLKSILIVLDRWKQKLNFIFTNYEKKWFFDGSWVLKIPFTNLQ